MDVECYREAFRGSPMRRAKLPAMKRNAPVVLGNVGTADDVAAAVARVLRSVIGGRVLPFDRAAAQAYPEIAARRRRATRGGER